MKIRLFETSESFLYKKIFINLKNKALCQVEKREKDIRCQLTKERKDLERTDIRKNKSILF